MLGDKIFDPAPKGLKYANRGHLGLIVTRVDTFCFGYVDLDQGVPAHEVGGGHVSRHPLAVGEACLESKRLYAMKRLCKITQRLQVA